ncbi:MAG: alpha,alpha-trehalase TreF [Spartobacteria bacterium]|nr:alpha,alpha-trehalase TreF [Spartobacteria bacterium]
MNDYIQTLGSLFDDVQRGGIFRDSKTFPDSIPRYSPETILQVYEQQRRDPGFNLARFVAAHFIVPDPAGERGLDVQPGLTMEEHINHLWVALRRDPDTNIPPGSSLLELPEPYIVPGGRFREIYYWDTYFTCEGLAASYNHELVEDMVMNFAFLIDKYGHIPNGSRTYFLSRSHPPFFCSMLELLERTQGIDAVIPYLPYLLKEYRFWMDGVGKGFGEIPAYRRVVFLDEDTVLNRYWDDSATPRPEAWREDICLAEQTWPDRREDMFRNIRAACESGWDFSSRWLRDPAALKTLYTTELIPVDLNSILYHMESKLAQWLHLDEQHEMALRFENAAAKRRIILLHLCWDKEHRFFFDYCWTDQRRTTTWSLAAVYPLFFKMAEPEMAANIALHLEKKFLQPGGLLTTLHDTGQQWDAPNGWAPLHWLAVIGLRHYGYTHLAHEIANRFIALAGQVYEQTGRMEEKYNVRDLSLRAGGGEYPLQDGFGWTNGIVQALRNLYPFPEN